MRVMKMATQNKKKNKRFYCIKGEWKELTPEQFKKESKLAFPLRAKMLSCVGRLFALTLTLAILFIAITVVYSAFKWAIGVWI